MDNLNQDAEIIHQILKDDGTFPNNEELPVIVYKKIITFSEEGNATEVERIFNSNGWGNSWRNGIYTYHHYHSTAHEVLGVYDGNAKIQLGGPDGQTFHVEMGDVILIPAGVAHKNLGSSPDFRVVGAYPKGQSWDMNYGKRGERPEADENIKIVKLPDKDPVQGEKGPLLDLWL